MTNPTTPQNAMTAKIIINKIITHLTNLQSIYTGAPEEMKEDVLHYACQIETKTQGWLRNEEKRRALNNWRKESEK